MGKKRSKRSLSSSINTEDMTADGDNAHRVKDAIEALREAMEAGFAGLRSDMDKLSANLNQTLKNLAMRLNNLDIV